MLNNCVLEPDGEALASNVATAGCRRAHIGLRQVEREHTPLSRHAPQSNLAAQQTGQLTADGQPKTGTAVLAARPGIRLLKRLEDNSLFFERNTNARIGNLEGDHRCGPAEDRVVLTPSCLGYRNRETHTALLGEFECIGQ